MPETKMVDIHNRGEREYHSPSGISIKQGQTVALPADEAESLLKGYPKDLITPESLRSSSGPTALEIENESLKAELERLKSKGAKTATEAKV